ncbi:MAG TPA: exonuclease SbcCD subunit D C-terminal domain-containing protein [Myxococcota bacterium]|nr:exonuclease SbcCD subunit D C-terminal domain-containing protein [Myxococcota bacterium]
MRLLHTADWHLGHTLGDYDRSEEHAAFLDFLLEQIEINSVDALLIAGDIFETANPPVRAERTWYDFLARARARFPSLDIVAIGGNHDSAPRLDAPRPVLSTFGVRVVGGLPFRSGKQIDTGGVLVPLHDQQGIAAWVIAVPYLRAGDLPSVPSGHPVHGGVRAVYQTLLAAARERIEPGVALIGMGHLHAEGGSESPDSERKVFGHALQADALFGDAFAYVALGHLHKAQELAPGVRYSGSPIPLSMTERTYEHQVLLVELEGEELVSTTPILVPRMVDLLRIPDEGELPLGAVLERLSSLPDRDLANRTPPFLEVRVSLEQPEPTLRRRIEDAIEAKAVRLLRVRTAYTGSGEALTSPEVLQDLEVEDVFLRMWAKDHSDPPPDTVIDAFRSLLDDAASLGQSA